MTGSHPLQCDVFVCSLLASPSQAPFLLQQVWGGIVPLSRDSSWSRSKGMTGVRYMMCFMAQAGGSNQHNGMASNSGEGPTAPTALRPQRGMTLCIDDAYRRPSHHLQLCGGVQFASDVLGHAPPPRVVPRPAPGMERGAPRTPLLGPLGPLESCPHLLRCAAVRRRAELRAQVAPGSSGSWRPRLSGVPVCCAEGAVTKGQKAGMSTHGYR